MKTNAQNESGSRAESKSVRNATTGRLATLKTIPAMCGGRYVNTQAERIGTVCRETKRRGFQRLSRLPTAASNREAGLFADRSPVVGLRCVASRRLSFSRKKARNGSETEEFLRPFGCSGQTTRSLSFVDIGTRQEIDSRSRRRPGEVSAPLDRSRKNIYV